VNVNEAYSATWGSTDSPIGGMKQSGLSARHGAEGLLKYTVPQTIAQQRWWQLGAGPDAAFYARLMTFLVRRLKRLL
jgi:hypothetical protein